MRQAQLEKQALFFRNLTWQDLSTHTYCELKIEVIKSPKVSVRIDIIQHGTDVVLFKMIGNETAKNLLKIYGYDLELMSQNIKIVNGN